MNPHLGASAKAINNAADASRKIYDGRTTDEWPFYLQFSRGQGPKTPSLRSKDPKMVGENCTDALEETPAGCQTFRGGNLQPLVAAFLCVYKV